jgi:hypothetical protein
MPKNVKAEFAVTDAGKFPLESCREKLARQYGQNAVCLSGPCEGSSLVDCVCKQLKDRWSSIEQRFAGDQGKLQKLASKLAATFMEADKSTAECAADLEKAGWEKTAAGEITGYLKAYAMPKRMDEVFAQLMNEVQMGGGMPMGAPEVESAMSGGAMGGETQMAGGMGMGGMGEMQMADSGTDPMAGGDMIDMPTDGLDMDGGMGGDAPLAPAPDAGMGDDMPGGMGGDMGGGMGGDMMGGDTITIELPMDVADELLNAIEGHMHSGGTDMDMDMGNDAGGDMSLGDESVEVVDDDTSSEGDDAPSFGGDDDDSVEVVDDDSDTGSDVPGEPADEKAPGEQFVTNDKEDSSDSTTDNDDTSKEAAMALKGGRLQRVGQTVLKLAPEMSINNTDQQAGGKDLGKAKEKEIADPKALPEGNVHPDGHTAGGNKFQDGSTMGAEEKFDAKQVGKEEVSKGNASLMGKEEPLNLKGPSIPAGGGRIGNEPEMSVNLETKGTVIATITPKGVIVVGPDGKKYHAQRDLSTKVANKDYQQKLAGLLGKITETDGKLFAKAAHKAMKLAETSGGQDNVTKIDTAKKEGEHFTNDAEKKPEEGGAMVGSGGAKQDKDHPTTDTSKKESEHFQNDAEKKPEEGGAMSTKAGSEKAVKVAGEEKSDKENVVSDVGKEIGKKKSMDEQVEVEGHTAGGNKFQDGGTMGAEEKFDAKEVKESDVSSMGSSLMGNEKDPNFKNPKVPVGTDHPEENYKPEGDVKIKGTVMAGQSQNGTAEEAMKKMANDAKVREERLKAAGAYVADLLSHGEITPAEYAQELEKFAALPVQAIKALAVNTAKARERVAAKAQKNEQAHGALNVPLVLTASITEKDKSLKDKLVDAFKLTRDMRRLEDSK